MVMYPSATGRAHDKECSPANDRRSTAVPRSQLAFRLATPVTSCYNDVILY